MRWFSLEAEDGTTEVITKPMLRLELVLVFLEEERVMQQSSVIISLNFENQGINPVGDYTQVPRTCTNKTEPRNQRNKGVVSPFMVTYESEI